MWANEIPLWRVKRETRTLDIKVSVTRAREGKQNKSSERSESVKWRRTEKMGMIKALGKKRQVLFIDRIKTISSSSL